MVKSIAKENNDPLKNSPNRNFEYGICVMNFVSLKEMDEHKDQVHEGRWKLGDPDVINEGNSYQESSKSKYSSTNSDSE